jgi:hypothetical protein
MKMLMSCGAAVALLACAALAAEKGAAEKGLKSGLQVGDSVGFFEVVKCGGAADDDVSVGDKLCYR